MLLVTVTSGAAAGPQAGRGYSGIAARGTSGFIAIGAWASNGSEGTVG